LAKASGINHTTLAKHIAGSEPTRPFLNGIAKAAGVNVGWLASGIGSRDDNDEVGPSEESGGSPNRKRLWWLTNEQKPWVPGGPGPSEFTEIRSDRLARILDRTVAPTVGEATLLCEYAKVALFRILVVPDPKSGVETDASDGNEFLRQSFAANNLIASTKLQVAITEMLRPLNDYQFFVHQLENDFMSPAFERGDILIGDKAVSGSGRNLQGTFIVSDDGIPFACNLTPDRFKLKISFNKPNLPALEREFDDSAALARDPNFKILGRVVHHLSLRSI
jgi:hypothetical protein